MALQLGGLYANRALWPEAESWFAEALELQPNSPEAMAGLVAGARGAASGTDPTAAYWFARARAKLSAPAGPMPPRGSSSSRSAGWLLTWLCSLLCS